MVSKKILVCVVSSFIFSGCATTSPSSEATSKNNFARRSVASNCKSKYVGQQDFEEMFNATLVEFTANHATNKVTTGSEAADGFGNCHALISIDGKSLGEDVETNYKAFMSKLVEIFMVDDIGKANFQDKVKGFKSFTQKLILNLALAGFTVDPAVTSDEITIDHKATIDGYSGVVWNSRAGQTPVSY